LRHGARLDPVHDKVLTPRPFPFRVFRTPVQSRHPSVSDLAITTPRPLPLSPCGHVIRAPRQSSIGVPGIPSPPAWATAHLSAPCTCLSSGHAPDLWKWCLVAWRLNALPRRGLTDIAILLQLPARAADDLQQLHQHFWVHKVPRLVDGHQLAEIDNELWDGDLERKCGC